MDVNSVAEHLARIIYEHADNPGYFLLQTFVVDFPPFTGNHHWSERQKLQDIFMEPPFWNTSYTRNG